MACAAVWRDKARILTAQTFVGVSLLAMAVYQAT
ncbi:hypothetical protein EMIT093MI4_90141 [Pseudomonas sp. IT-93MI4]